MERRAHPRDAQGHPRLKPKVVRPLCSGYVGVTWREGREHFVGGRCSVVVLAEQTPFISAVFINAGFPVALLQTEPAAGARAGEVGKGLPELLTQFTGTKLLGHAYNSHTCIEFR